MTVSIRSSAAHTSHGLQARECGACNNPVSDLFDALAVQFESRAQMLDLANILRGLNIKLNGLVLLTRDEC